MKIFAPPSYRPNLLSYKRPTARDLVLLQKIVQERERQGKIPTQRELGTSGVIDPLTDKPLRTLGTRQGYRTVQKFDDEDADSRYDGILKQSKTGKATLAIVHNAIR